MFKKSKQILLFIGGFFYSFVVITIASTLEYNKRFIYLLLMLIANLSVGLVYGYTFYCTGSAVAALVISLITGTPVIPLLVSIWSPVAHLSQLAFLLPILLPILPYVAISLPLIYIGVGVIDSLASCLWHSTLDFYEYGLSKKGLFSPFTYLLPIFNYDPRYADTEELKNHLEERAIKTKVEILETYAHRFSDTSMLILKRLVPVPALITHISEYAYTAASSIPKRIDSRNFTSWSQDMTIYMEGKLCRYYGIRRDENSILKGRSYYDNNNATERTAVFKCDLFLRSFDMTELKDVDIANLSKEHCTPTLMREDDVFWIYRIAKDGDWQWTKLKLSFEEATLLNQLPFEKEIIKRTDTRFPNVVDLLKKHEVDFEQKNIIQQFRSVRFAPLV